MKKNNICDISFIIPCYRSEETIGNVIGEIEKKIQELSIDDYEIIAIDDCSPDDVYLVLKKMGETNSRIKAIQFSKNFGQHAGMIAGIRHSCGKICVCLDDDGQCPIQFLDDLIKPLALGYDISIAQYGKKKQSLFKNIGSQFNEMVANILIDKPKDIQMGNFMAFRRFIADEICQYIGPYPYISGLLFRSSAKVINVPMQERRRMCGRTTYTFRKLFSLWVNSFTAFSIKPLRFATTVGTISSIIGLCLAFITAIRKLVNPAIAIGWSSTMAIILLLGGLILFVLGVIGEYIGRIYMSINATPQYVISDTNNINGSQNNS